MRGFGLSDSPYGVVAIKQRSNNTEDDSVGGVMGQIRKTKAHSRGDSQGCEIWKVEINDAKQNGTSRVMHEVVNLPFTTKQAGVYRIFMVPLGGGP